MEPHDPRFIVGIDLGTTNSAVAHVDLQVDAAKPPIERFAIPQLTGPGEVDARAVLPSFLYIPGEYDISREALKMPWQGPVDNFAGTFARDHGARVPARLVASAKSWLCHANADRRAKILPWGADDEVAKVSPVQAAGAYLSHIRNAWNRAHPDADDALERQLVIVTVPASFDEVARELTVEAAATAGLPSIILLEEPLAAFYSWLMAHESDWRESVRPNELILVCDVGGGTTDFTLIYLKDDGVRPAFERLAVGDHLILGGDNIDLALARFVERQFDRKKDLFGGDRWKTLCHQSRQAKERILDGKSDSETITILGAGGQLIGGTLTARIDRDDVVTTILEGFFPVVAPTAAKGPTHRKGITEFGLPYEPEPAITRHLGWFLERHRGDVQAFLGKDRPSPDLILFNGGSLKPALVQSRIRAAIGRWFDRPAEELPRILANPDPDLAVSLGAAYYGMVKIGRGVRVGSGSPRAYYLEVAPRSKRERTQAICLVERGLEEGTQVELKTHQFDVRANQPVRFNLYSSSYRSGDRPGDIVAVDDTLTTLAPIETVVQYGKKGTQKSIPVELAAEYTEIGTLALSCRSRISDHRWKLQFQLRGIPAAVAVADQEVYDDSRVASSRGLIRKVFTDQGAGRRLERVAGDVAERVGRPRLQWPLTFLRALADELLRLEGVRRFSPLHEIRWLNLLGYCLRPGMADGADPVRMKTVWRCYSEGPLHGNQAQVRTEWWIFWRRVAAGLTPGQQRQFIQDLATLLLPKKNPPRRIAPQERLEMWMAAANMEYLHAKDKARWGRSLLAELTPKKSKPQHFWSLSRLGARDLLYGPVDRVVPPSEVSAWVDVLLHTPWRDPRPVAAALGQICRKTGDRTRDLDQALRDRVVHWMTADPAKAAMMDAHLPYVRQIVARAASEESVIFGEDLPAGIVLRPSE